MSRINRRDVLWPVLSWLLALTGPVLWRAAGMQPEFWPPRLPNIVRDPVFNGMATDVVSSVGNLLWVLAFSIAIVVQYRTASKSENRQSPTH